MAHLCIKYRLTPEGTVPYFLCLHPEGVGGQYLVPDPTVPAPRDFVLVGLSENEDIGDAELVPTQEDLLAYLISVSDGWTEPDPNNPDILIPFDPVAAAQWVWDRKALLDELYPNEHV
jgi:hypothetical protein